MDSIPAPARAAPLPPGAKLVRAADLAPLKTETAESFAAIAETVTASPLHEIAPAEAGDVGAALGFALGLTRLWAAPLTVFISPQARGGEDGTLYAEGCAQLGLALDDLILVRPRTAQDALWAAEQALTLPGAAVVCVIGSLSRDSGKTLDLTASRRLLLAAETYGARGLLVRLDGLAASAAWTRWRIAAAVSAAAPGEIGRPAFAAQLTRRRGGRADLCWILDWDAHAHRFSERDAPMAGALAAAAANGPAAARRAG